MEKPSPLIPSHSLRPLHLYCLFAAALIYLGTEVWQCISWPPFYSFDETLEIDYVYQLTQGHLPTFWAGPEFNPLGLEYPYQVQWRYQHPPLFYLIETPIFVLFNTNTHPIIGIWAMRMVVCMLGLLLIAVSGWAARWIFGHTCVASALVPVFIASNRCLPSVVLNYTLAALWVTLLIGMTAKILRTYPRTTRATAIAWIAIVTLAPLTRLSTVPIMGLCICIVALFLLIRCCKSLCAWTSMVAAPSLLAILSSGWFYLRLYTLSGSFTGSQPQWSAENLHRITDKTFFEALADPSFYISSFSQYQNSAVTTQWYGGIFVILLTLLPLLLGGITGAHHIFSRNHRTAPNTLIAIMILLAFGGTVFQQLLFYKQGGSSNAVYFSLISIVFSVVIAYGFARRPMFHRYTAIWLFVRLAAFLIETILKWPFAESGTMEGRSILWIVLTYCAILLVIAGTTLAIIAISRNRSPNQTVEIVQNRSNEPVIHQ